MKPNLIAIVFLLLAASPTIRAAPEIDPHLTKQLLVVLQEVEKVRVGMKREDLMKVFTIEGGLSTAAQCTFVSQRCPMIKVDVTFTLAENQNVLEERSSDKISAISKPYLAWPIDD